MKKPGTLLLCFVLICGCVFAYANADETKSNTEPSYFEIYDPDEFVDPDSEEVLNRLEQGMFTGASYGFLLKQEDPEIWGSSWEIIDGVLYDTHFHALLYYPNEKTDEVYHVEPGTLYIAAGALHNMYLKEIWLPDGIKVIGRDSLTGFCDNNLSAVVQMVHVPVSIELIASPVASAEFSWYTHRHPLFDIAEGNLKYKNVDGLLIDTENSSAIYCADQEKLFEVTVPEGIKSIAPYAFAGLNNCVRVRLPRGLEAIGEYAFYCAWALGNLNIPDTVQFIGSKAFNYIGESLDWLPDDLVNSSTVQIPKWPTVITVEAAADSFKSILEESDLAYCDANIVWQK